MRPREKPTSVVAVEHGDTVTRESHPAYAKIAASRVQGAANLFGSDLGHHQYIVVRIARADLARTLAHDWVHAGGAPLVEVAMSEAQWATFISTLNMGDGVPCTLESANGKAIPGIEMVRDRREQFAGEMKERTARSLRAIDEAVVLVESGEAPTKKLLAELSGLLRTARQNVDANVAFVAESFDGHMDRVTEAAKIEVHTYATSVVHRAGLDAIAAYRPPELPATTIEPAPLDAPAAGHEEEKR